MNLNYTTLSQTSSNFAKTWGLDSLLYLNMAHLDWIGSMIFSDELAASANRVVLLKFQKEKWMEHGHITLHCIPWWNARNKILRKHPKVNLKVMNYYLCHPEVRKFDVYLSIFTLIVVWYQNCTLWENNCLQFAPISAILFSKCIKNKTR